MSTPLRGPALVVAHARSMIGVPWRHQGRKPWAVDCLGLVVLSLVAAKWPGVVHLPARYGTDPWDDQLRKGLRAHLGEPVTGDWRPGDVPLFRWGKGDPSHVGILGDDIVIPGGVSIIHASLRYTEVVETSLVGALRDCVIEVYRPEWPADE